MNLQIGAPNLDLDRLERELLADELHDDPIQALAAAGWQMEALATRLGPEDQARLRDISELIAHAQRRLRSIMIRLRPPDLDPAGLVSALGCLAEDLLSGSGVASTVTGKVPAGLSPAVARLVATIVSHTLELARTGSTPSRLEIEVGATPDGAGLLLVIRYDGVAPRPAEDGQHGARRLTIIEPIVIAGGGTFELTHDPTEGCRVCCWLPLSFDSSETAAG